MRTENVQNIGTAHARSLDREQAIDVQKGENEFDNMVLRILGEDKKEINEEELFSIMIGERISKRDNSLVATYEEELANAKQRHTRADGYIFVEDAANEALDKLIERGLLDQKEGEVIRAEAFRAAQLDDNLEKLYDSRGSESDPTIAVASLESALTSSRALIEKLDSGELDIKESTEAGKNKGEIEVESAETIDGEGGFQFNPVSERDGNLAVLFPSNLAGRIQEVILKDSEGELLERGVSFGTNDDNREIYRFTKPGKRYPDNITVEVILDDGSVVSYKISNPSKRHD